MADRKSEAEIPTLIIDPVELAKKEAENALAQFDWAMEEVERWIAGKSPNLKISMVLNLHRMAMDGIDQYAGNFRPAGVAIRGSSHVPVASGDVARYVEEMLEYIEESWGKKTAVHLSSYVMWRLNWVHPFADGNGRTSRMLSYMVLCGHLRQILPGSRTIPEQISENKKPYYDALEEADKNYKSGSVDVSSMERLLEGYLANQLVEVHDKATGSLREQNIAMPTETRVGFLDKIENRPVLIGGAIAIFLALLGWFLS